MEPMGTRLRIVAIENSKSGINQLKRVVARVWLFRLTV
jgi:hypothetical protein